MKTTENLPMTPVKEIVTRTATQASLEHNLIDLKVEDLCDGMIRLICETFSAHKVARRGFTSDLALALRSDGRFVANPTVVTDRVGKSLGRSILSPCAKPGPWTEELSESLLLGSSYRG